MDKGDGHAAFAYAGSDALDGTGANVAGRKYSWYRTFEQVGMSLRPPALFLADFMPGKDETVTVTRDLGRQPRRVGIGPDKNEESARFAA